MNIISAAIEANERAEPFAGTFVAATHAVLTQDGEEHVLTLVKVTHELLLPTRIETGLITSDITIDILPVTVRL